MNTQLEKFMESAPGYTQDSRQQHRINKFQFLLELLGTEVLKNLLEQEKVSDKILEAFKKACIEHSRELTGASSFVIS